MKPLNALTVLAALLLAAISPALAQNTPDPAPVAYTVQPGQTLTQIARGLGLPLTDLLAANGLSATDTVAPGQVLWVPATHAEAAARLALAAAPRPAALAVGDEEEDDNVLNLDVFVVQANRDSYTNPNQVTGTRFEAAIREIPFTSEVITKGLIEDIGALDIKEAVRFTAGIETNILNQQPGENTSQETAYRLRGLVSEFALRNGFGRIGQTDTFNIAQVDVVRGPAALLYGIGNFGGVVNYVTERPSEEFEARLGTAVGSHDFYRADARLSGAVYRGERHTVTYSFSAFLQDQGSHIDHLETTRWGVAPVFNFKLNKNKTNILLEFERLRREGTKVENPLGQAYAGFTTSPFYDNEVLPAELVIASGTLPAGSANPRGLLTRPYQEFRWFGQDTEVVQEDTGMLVQVLHELVPNLVLTAGYYFSENVQEDFSYTGGGVTSAANVNDGSQEGQRLQSTYPWLTNPLDPSYDAWSTRDRNGNPDFQVLSYSWQFNRSKQRRDQFRVDATWKFDFEKFQNTLTFGGTYNEITFSSDYVELLKDTSRPQGITGSGASRDFTGYQNAYARLQSIRDYTPVRFQPGPTEVLLNPRPATKQRFFERGFYLMHQGRFLDGRVRTVTGWRFDSVSIKVPGDRDDATGEVVNYAFRPGGPATYTSPSFGLSVDLTEALALYVVTASAVQPVYRQTLADGLVPDPTNGQSYEVGLKFDLFDNRVSGTAAVYWLEREGVVAGRSIGNQGFPDADTNPFWEAQGRGGSSTSNALSDDRSAGLDLQVQFSNFVRGLQTIVNFSYNDYELQTVYAPSYNPSASDPNNGVFVFDTVEGQINEELRNNDVPEFSFGLWTKYKVEGETWFRGFDIGAGYRWTSEREASYGSNDPTSFRYIEAFGEIYAALGYERRLGSGKLAVRFNASNLADNTEAVGYTGYRAPTNYRLTVRYDF